MSRMAYSEQRDVLMSSGATRIARLMGLPTPGGMTDLALVERIEKGLPLRAVEEVARVVNPDDKAAIFTLLSRSTYSRLKRAPKNRLSKEMSEKLHGVARVLDEALQLWKGDTEAVGRFLNRPHSLLQERTPFEVARESTVGADLVAKIIGEARAGVAV